MGREEEPETIDQFDDVMLFRQTTTKRPPLGKNKRKK